MSLESQIKDLREELKHINGKLNVIAKTVDSQQQDFEQRITQAVSNFHDVMSYWTVILATSIEAMLIIRYYAAREEELTSDELKEGVISCLQRLEELRGTLQLKELEDLRTYTWERQRLIFGALLDLAKRKEISPGEILALLQEALETEGVRAVVSIEQVARVFGTSEASRWKKLLKH